MSADRNLLFGILALQLNFVTRDQLVEGMHAWVLDKTKSLGKIFVASNAMHAEEYKLLEALVDKHVEKHDGDIGQSLRQLSSVDPFASQQLQAIEDSDLSRSIHHLAADPFATAPLSQATNRSSSRFRIVRPHARGGLGQVFVAQDTELSREVALKEIQERYADQQDSRGRFVREAEITARLEHPGIVPVYGLGTYDDGRPFYAMKLVKGQSLQEAIEEFHSSPRTKADTSFVSGDVAIQFRELLGRFVDVCNAVHYAHSRGILHRDLKPGNVMIGEYGETLVVDWGLAKVLGTQLVTDSNKSLIEPSSGSGSAPTRYGSAIGTPGYMSPEQAAGQVDSLGTASDVYSLGVTLYALLTGQAPFHEELQNNKGLSELLERVVSGQFRNPRAVRPGLPKPLVAICLKAMATSVELRYRSARELATEIERYLADEPVDAFPESISTRSLRLARRHRSLLLAVSLSLLAIATISTVAFFIVDQQRKSNATLADVNGQLARDKGELAERNAQLYESERESKNAARKAASEISTLASTLSLEKGTDWMKRGDLDIAANWFARAYALPTDEKTSSDRVARKNLNVCLESMHKLERVLLDSEPLLAVVRSPDADAIITCSLKGRVRQLSLADGTWAPRCQLGDGELSAVAISPKSDLAATIDKAGKFKLWNSQSGEQVDDARSDTTESATALAFSPEGDMLAVAFSKGVQLWNCDTRSWMDQAVPTDFYIGSLAFDPNANFLVMGFNKTKVWSLKQQKWLGDLDVGHTCFGIAVDGHGSSILVARWMEAKMFRWRGDSFQVSMQKHGIAFVRSVAFNSSSTMFCATGSDGLATVWDVERQKRIAQPLRHTSQDIQGCLFSMDGRRLITYGGREQGQAELRIWRISNRSHGDLVLRHDTPIVSTSYSNDGSLIAFFDAKSRVYVAERSSGRILSGPLSHRVLHYTGAEPCSSLCFLRDNQVLCSTSMSGGVCLWDWRNSKLFIDPLDNGDIVNAPNTNSVRGACLSSDGRHLIVAGGLTGSMGYARAYDWTSGRKVNEFVAPGNRVHCVASVPGENSVLVGGDFPFTKLWSLDSSESSTDQIKHPGTVYSLAFADNGRTLLAGYYQDNALAWDFPKKTMKGAPLDHSGYVRKIAVSHDRAEFITGDAQHLRRWDMESQNAIGPPISIPNYHDGVALAPDGSEAIAGYPDGSIWSFTAQTSGPLSRDEIRDEVAVVTGIQVDDAGAVRALTESEWTIAQQKVRGKVYSLKDFLPEQTLTQQGKFQQQVYFGDVNEALTTAESWYADAKDQPQSLYRAAGMFAQCVRMIKGTRELTLPSKQSLLSQAQSRAVQALREAIRAGYVAESFSLYAREFEGVRELPEIRHQFFGPFTSAKIQALGEEAKHLDLAYTRQDNRVCIANMGTGSAQLWNFDSIEMGRLDWINDGQKLIVRQNGHLLGFDPLTAGSRRVHLILEPATRRSAVSPTGNHTAFESTKTYEIPKVIVMDNQTRKGVVITHFGYDPSWSLDGKTLALFDISNTARSGVIDLYAVEEILANLKSEESVTLPLKPKVTLEFQPPRYGHVHPTLSADGALVAFGIEGDDGTRQIGLATVENRQVRQLTRNGKDNALPSFSPDGRYIAYIRNAHASFELVVWDLQKEEETVIAEEVAFCRPAWRAKSPGKQAEQ